MKKQLHQVLNKCGFTLQKVDKSTDEQDYKELYSEDSLKNRRFYNIGAGEFAHPFWTNVDNGNDFYSEINGKSKHGISHDLFDHKPLPIEDNSAEVIYTSHTMEHIDNTSVSFLFRDAYRILKKGGVIRVVVPNIELSYAAWQRGDRKYFFWADWPTLNENYEKFSLKIPFGQASLGQMFLDEFATSVCEIVNDGSEKRLSDQELQKIFKEMPFEEAVNYCISLCSIENQKKYPFRHINGFTGNKLQKMLGETGFQTISKSGYLQSEVPVLRNSRFFDKTVPQASLFVEAKK